MNHVIESITEFQQADIEEYLAEVFENCTVVEISRERFVQILVDLAERWGED